MQKIIHLSDLHIGHGDCGKKFRSLFMPQIKDFPHLEMIDNFAIITLDSNLDKLLDSSEIKNKIKVAVLHHHPFDMLPFHHLKDAKKFKKIIQNRVDILLYGHNHMGRTNHGALGIRICMDGGSSSGKPAIGIFGIKVRHRIIDTKDFSVIEKDYLNTKE